MDHWKRLHADFMELMAEEERISHQSAPRSYLCVSGIYRGPAKFGEWVFAHVTTESLKARFEMKATESGVALGTPSGVLPGNVFLHRLFAYLREIGSKHIVSGDEYGGVIQRLLEASAMFCAYLYRKSLEAKYSAESSPEEQTQFQIEKTKDKPDRRALRDAYFVQFPGTLILDICWAAGQHYSEWKRWLRGSSVLKDGSAPDLAFSDILTSGESPAEHRKQSRPKGWK